MPESTVPSSMRSGLSSALIRTRKVRPEEGDLEVWSYLSGPFISLKFPDLKDQLYVLPAVNQRYIHREGKTSSQAAPSCICIGELARVIGQGLVNVEASENPNNPTRAEHATKVALAIDIRDAVKAHRGLREFYESLHKIFQTAMPLQSCPTINDSDFRVNDQPPMKRLYQIPCGQDLTLSRSTPAGATSDESSIGKVVYYASGEASGAQVSEQSGEQESVVCLRFCPRLMLSEHDGIEFMCATIEEAEGESVIALKNAIESQVSTMFEHEEEYGFRGTFKDLCGVSTATNFRTAISRGRAAVLYSRLFLGAAQKVVESAGHRFKVEPIDQRQHHLDAGH